MGDVVLRKSLSDLKTGQAGTISRIGGGGSLRRRLLDMGLVAGSEVAVKRVAPLGDPLEIRVKGYSLMLRRAEAASIEIVVD